jgi:hypothetical protein
MGLKPALEKRKHQAAPTVIHRLRASGVIACLTKPLDLTERGQRLDSFAAGYAHGTEPAPWTVPTP